MASNGPAFCSSLMGALTLLFRMMVALNLMLLYSFCQSFDTLQIAALRYRYLLYCFDFWTLSFMISIVAIPFIEVASITDCLFTQLGTSLYRTRIAVSYLFAFPVIAMAIVAIRMTDESIAKSLNQPIWESSSAFEQFLYRILPAVVLIPNLHILFAIILGGGFKALAMEARATWKTLKIAEIIGLKKEWADADIEHGH